MALSWQSPSSGTLTTELELDTGSESNPIYTVELEVDDTSTPDIYFVLQSGLIPDYYEILQSGSNTGTLQITELIRDLDEYVPGYTRPENFSYDTEDTAGGNYVSYGSALTGGYTFNFTIRAYDVTGETTYTDSNGNIQYDLDSNFLDTANYVDRTFTIVVQTNWSTKRDKFIRENFEDETLIYDGEELSPDDFLIAIKNGGYYG